MSKDYIFSTPGLWIEFSGDLFSLKTNPRSGLRTFSIVPLVPTVEVLKGKSHVKGHSPSPLGVNEPSPKVLRWFWVSLLQKAALAPHPKVIKATIHVENSLQGSSEGPCSWSATLSRTDNSLTINFPKESCSFHGSLAFLASCSVTLQMTEHCGLLELSIRSFPLKCHSPRDRKEGWPRCRWRIVGVMHCILT